MPIGKVINVPPQGYQWGQIRGEYGNTWNVHRDNLPEDTDPGEQVAYRLDFSSPLRSPQILTEDD